MIARKTFYSTIYDPSKPIDFYIQAVTAKQWLVNLGLMIGESELKDVLLMNLHPLFVSLCTTILAQCPEPSLDDICSLLTSTTDTNIKIKEEHLLYLLYTHSQPHGHGSPQTSSANPIDDKGYTWCDAACNGCHHCGCPGHVAAKCMISMPDHVKDWILAGTSAVHSYIAAEHIPLDRTSEVHANFFRPFHPSIDGKSANSSDINLSNSRMHSPSNSGLKLL